MNQSKGIVGVGDYIKIIMVILFSIGVIYFISTYKPQWICEEWEDKYKITNNLIVYKNNKLLENKDNDTFIGFPVMIDSCSNLNNTCVIYNYAELNTIMKCDPEIKNLCEEVTVKGAIYNITCKENEILRSKGEWIRDYMGIKLWCEEQVQGDCMKKRKVWIREQ